MSRRRLGIQLPDDWKPTKASEAVAINFGYTHGQFLKSLDLFKDWAKGGGKIYSDWDATYRNGLRTWLREKVGIDRECRWY